MWQSSVCSICVGYYKLHKAACRSLDLKGQSSQPACCLVLSGVGAMLQKSSLGFSLLQLSCIFDQSLKCQQLLPVLQPSCTSGSDAESPTGVLLVLCSAAITFSRQRPEGSGRATAVSPEPEVMSPPSSPRLRHSTFGATLDFIEALCDASSGLTAFAAVSIPIYAAVDMVACSSAVGMPLYMNTPACTLYAVVLPSSMCTLAWCIWHGA